MTENLAKRGRIDDNNNDIIINSKTVSRVNLEKIETFFLCVCVFRQSLFKTMPTNCVIQFICTIKKPK